MVGSKEKGQTCDKGSQEDDWISKLPDVLISYNILAHLAIKDVVRTSVLSTKWRHLWKWVPGLDLDSLEFSSLDKFVNFGDRFFDFHRESWILKLKLSIYDPDIATKPYLSSWVDAMTKRRVQQLDVHFDHFYCPNETLVSMTSETLVELRLSWVALGDAEFLSLPSLKIMHLHLVSCINEATLEKLISGSPVLEDLAISRRYDDFNNVIQVRSQKLKRIQINPFTEVVIDAPLLQFLKTVCFFKKNYEIINSGFPATLDIDVIFGKFDPYSLYCRNVVLDFLTDISKVRELVICCYMWKGIFLYSKSYPLLQFPYLSCLNAGYHKSDIELLPTLLESCPKLESLILEEKGTDDERPNVMFSTVPQCLVSSLKFVELKRCKSISEYEGEMELIRYFLKYSTILEKMKLDNYYTEKEKYAILTMQRCSNACEVL